MFIANFNLGIGFNKDGEPQGGTFRDAEQAVMVIAQAEGYTGGTLFRTNGFWISDDNTVVREPGLKLEILTDVDDFDQAVTQATSLAQTLAQYFDQDCVLFTIQPVMLGRFVKQPTGPEPAVLPIGL